MINLTRSRKSQRPEGNETGLAIRSGLERLFEQFFEPFSGGSGLMASMVMPPMEFVERENETIVSVELPGMNADDIDVTVSGNQLVISGEKRDENEDRRRGYYRSERRYGMFRRVLDLPHDLDAENLNVEFDAGVLKIGIPHSAAQQPRRIPVKGSSGQGGGQKGQVQSGRQSQSGQSRSSESTGSVGGRFQTQGDGSKSWSQQTGSAKVGDQTGRSSQSGSSPGGSSQGGQISR